jgi:hypothetical protein
MIRCRSSVPPNGDDCPAEADRLLVWKDTRRPDDDRPLEPKTPVCAECALQMQQRLPGAIIRVERITLVDKR